MKCGPGKMQLQQTPELLATVALLVALAIVQVPIWVVCNEELNLNDVLYVLFSQVCFL